MIDAKWEVNLAVFSAWLVALIWAWGAIVIPEWGFAVGAVIMLVISIPAGYARVKR